MSEEKGFTGTVLLIGAAVLGVVVLDRQFNGDPRTQPTRSATPPAATKSSTPPDYLLLARAEREVRATLKDPDSAVFTDMVVRRSPGIAVCGLVNSRNSFGGMTGPQKFVSGTVTAVEEQMGGGEMEKLWGQLGC